MAYVLREGRYGLLDSRYTPPPRACGKCASLASAEYGENDQILTPLPLIDRLTRFEEI